MVSPNTNWFAKIIVLFYTYAINYSSHHIILVDDGMQKDNRSSLPHHSWMLYNFKNFSDPYNPYYMYGEGTLVIVNYSKPLILHYTLLPVHALRGCILPTHHRIGICMLCLIQQDRMFGIFATLAVMHICPRILPIVTSHDIFIVNKSRINYPQEICKGVAFMHYRCYWQLHSFSYATQRMLGFEIANCKTP